MQITKLPHVDTEMLVRRPVRELFEAFTNPEITTKFWFTKSSGPLIAGKAVTWTWEMYGANAHVVVQQVEPFKKIVMDWGDESGMTQVEWTFTSVAPDQSVVRVVETGHKGSPDEIIGKVMDSLGGFNLALSAAKFYLEHKVNPRLILDRFTRP